MERGEDSNCKCGRQVVQRTSWTELNPGRRYIACENFRARGGCNFFMWIDPPMCERARQIIPGLLRRINTLEAEKEQKIHVHVDENEHRILRKGLPVSMMAWVAAIALVIYVLLF